MKTILQKTDKKLNNGFNVDKFKAALIAQNIDVKENFLSFGKAYQIGRFNHKNGVSPQYPENEHYMAGYNSYEPLIITRRRQGKKPQYTLADVDYQTELTGLPEWFNSISDAIYYACAVDVSSSKMGTGWRVTEYYEKYKTFQQKVFEDSQIKTDVKRLYQSTITGVLSTSIDDGKTWFDGGIMDYPKIPKVSIRELHGGKYRAIGVGWGFDYHYVNRTIPRFDEFKNGSFKLKPPRPKQPKFDAVHWRNDEFSWWNWHIENSPECRISHGDYDYSHKVEDERDKNDLPAHHTRCDCYHAKIAEYEKAVKKYKKALKKWENL